jgi:hypothetical protein
MKKSLANPIHSVLILVLLSACLNEDTLLPDDEGTPPEVVVTKLRIQVQYPAIKSYDSARIIFKNDKEEIRQKLILDSVSYVASGTVDDIGFGTWNISISFFKNTIENYKSVETNAAVNLDIIPTATALISTQNSIFIDDEKNQKAIRWLQYYYYQLHRYSDNSDTPDGFLRLPFDPTHPFIEIATFKPDWIYAYADRSFYNRSLDEHRNYYHGGGAFEVYGHSGSMYDRLDSDIVDTTSFVQGIASVRNKDWNLADCLVIVSGADLGEELVIYHVWDFRRTLQP